MKKILFFALWYFYSNTVHASSIGENSLQDSSDFCRSDLSRTSSSSSQDSKGKSLSYITELCQRPIGWLTQEQLCLLRGIYQNNSELSCFNELQMSPRELLRTNLTLLTFAELIIFEQINQVTIVINDEEIVSILKR